MDGEFIRLTAIDKGAPIFVRRSRVLSVGVWNGRTYVVLDAEEVNYEVRETPEQVVALVEGTPVRRPKTKRRQDNDDSHIRRDVPDGCGPGDGRACVLR